MSCLGAGYLPVPPRVWSRVQNSCSLDESKDNHAFAQAEATQMKNKGNVLQYKKNSSNLTKQQRYAKIARGQWTNRHITWASQSQTVSDPNTKQLKRVNSTRVTVDPVSRAITETTLPLSVCSKSMNPLVILDGGSMLCNAQTNVCTGQTKIQPSGPSYFPTSDSDVPGTIQYLTWDDNMSPWYPKPRRVMNNSGTKWPTGAKFIRTAHT